MKKIIFLIIIIPGFIFSQPKFRGGNSDGYAKQDAFTNLGGSVNAARFKGGNADGYAMQSAFTNLGGIINASRFLGGNSDGYALASAFNSLSGAISSGRYTGGSADGYMMGNTFNNLAGIISSTRYKGGAGDGYARSSVDINALPVEMSLFTASVYEKRNVKLSWITESEENNSGFEIQRGVYNTENIEWKKISFVNGAGTSNIAKEYSYQDIRVETGKYLYRLKQIDNNGNYNYFVLTSSIEVGIPNKFAVSQNYPNPFNPSTKIDIDIPKDGIVHLKIYDMAGREIAVLINGEKMNAGYYTKMFNGVSLSSGTYFYVVQADGQMISKRMVLVK